MRQVLVSADTEDIGGERCLIIVIRDITDRKRAERSLRESQAWLSAATDVAALGLYELREGVSAAYLDEGARSILGIRGLPVEVRPVRDS